MRKVISVLLILCSLVGIVFLGSCANTKPADTLDRPVKVMTLMGPTGMGMAKMINDNKDTYDFTLASAPDQISAQVIKGDYDIAAVPVNLASVLYNKTKGQLYIVGINTLGVLYILENGNTISSIEDLKGKTVYATGQGSNPEYVLNYILRKNNIDPETDLTIEYLAEHAELATRMISGSVSIGMLPEPNVSSTLINNADVHVALNVTEEWEKVSSSKLAQGCIIVNKAFADEHPEILKKFLDEYAESVEFVNNNIDQAATMIETAGIVPKAAIAKKAIPNCNIVLILNEEMKKMTEDMLNVLYEANPSSVGGTLPDDAFYLLNVK